jgi:PTS system ascorbate-specific IIA component
MAGILIVAHTPIASAMLSFAEHVYGAVPDHVRAVDIPPHEDAKVSFERVVEAARGVISEDALLVLTDVMGATPANVASRLMTQHVKSGPGLKVMVLAGLNLPMLMRAVSYRTDTLELLVQKTLQGGQNGILRLGAVGNMQTTDMQDR